MNDIMILQPDYGAPSSLLPIEGDAYFRDDNWAIVAKGGRAGQVVETCVHSGGEFFITFKAATMTWGWMAILRSIDSGDIPVHQAAVRWTKRDGDLLDEDFGSWIPLSAIARTLCIVERESL